MQHGAVGENRVLLFPRALGLMLQTKAPPKRGRLFVAEYLSPKGLGSPLTGNYIVCVGRDEVSNSPRINSIVAHAAAPASSCWKWTPMPCVRLACAPLGVIQTTLPWIAMRFSSCGSDSIMNTSSPSSYFREVGMKMPPPLRNGMY